ncbi:Lead, cadmium, zinc and mercury transporting ATPase; Copper-translocating P-type ATPase [hydrothermal vent metagenome]|uniref:Lead, cadmium, zinc and mercury transporting ATPase Copper-translocating P-type ATPase n=1 Tax=hydrothermal vent metagenome TaxID=652676 RepID=A0A3B1CC67_9ZZZZ
MPEPPPGDYCGHCGLPLPSRPVLEKIDGAQWRFCCDGCRRVCLALFEAGLQGYYDRTNQDDTRSPPPLLRESPSLYDIKDLLDDISSGEGAGDRREATLLVEGLDCAACVWLIERAMAATPGVLSAEVNLTHKRLRLCWDQQRAPLSTLLKRLYDVGYVAVPYTAGVAEEAARRAGRAALYRLGYAGFATMNLMWLSVALWTGADSGSFALFFRMSEMALAAPVLFYCAWPFLRGAVTGIRAGALTMDLPVALGASSVFGYSAYITLAPNAVGEVYFDTMSAFIFVLLAGRYIEMSARTRSVDITRRLLELQPRSARRINESGDEEVVSVKTIGVGDRVTIRPGERIPVDGIIHKGSGAIDESMITGESVPVDRGIGDRVVAGSLNDSGAYTIEVTARADETFLRHMANRIEKAQSSRARAQSYADAIVPWFVGATILLAGATFIYWFPEDPETALMYATAVLVVTCPCALGLATPLAVAYAVGLGSRQGIVVKQGAALEELSRVTDVVFDKTGSLTQGEYRLQSMAVASGFSEERLLQLVASVEAMSEHTLGRAVVQTAKERGVPLLSINNFTQHKGEGVTGAIGGSDITAGRRSFISRMGAAVPDNLTSFADDAAKRGLTTLFVAKGSVCCGVMAFGDRLRDEAGSVVARLQSEDISVSIFTGDREAVTLAITAPLPQPLVIRTQLRPGGKEKEITALKKEGKIVAMVGDGVNDALALSTAHVGVALASGSDLAMAAAEVVIMGGDLRRIPDAISLGRGMMSRIRQNLLISISYNVIMVPLAMAGFVTPVVAALAMPLSSIAVVLNASRIRLVSKGEEKKWM